MKKIDINSWARKAQWENFSKLGFPFYHVSFSLTVGPVIDWAKLHGVSSYHALCYLVAQSMNEVENFRYRIRGNEVWLVDEIHPCFTVMRPDGQEFQNLTCRMQPSIEAFCERAASLWRQEQELPRRDGDFVVGDTEVPEDEVIYMTCLPWIDSTEICSERSLDTNDSIPRVGWGRYSSALHDNRHERPRLNLSPLTAPRVNLTVDVNHRLIDGYHIGTFARRLQLHIRNL